MGPSKGKVRRKVVGQEGPNLSENEYRKRQIGKEDSRPKRRKRKGTTAFYNRKCLKSFNAQIPQETRACRASGPTNQGRLHRKSRYTKKLEGKKNTKKVQEKKTTVEGMDGNSELSWGGGKRPKKEKTRVVSTRHPSWKKNIKVKKISCR